MKESSRIVPCLGIRKQTAKSPNVWCSSQIKVQRKTMTHVWHKRIIPKGGHIISDFDTAQEALLIVIKPMSAV